MGIETPAFASISAIVLRLDEVCFISENDQLILTEYTYIIPENFLFVKGKKLTPGRVKSPHEARNDGMAPAPPHDDRKGRHYSTTPHARSTLRI